MSPDDNTVGNQVSKSLREQGKTLGSYQMSSGPVQTAAATFRLLTQAAEFDDLQEVFVNPANFPRIIADNQTHLFVISGEENSGKFAAALRLALLLIETDGSAFDSQNDMLLPVYVFLKSGHSLQLLNDLIIQQDFLDLGKAIVIVEDAAELGLQLDDLSNTIDFYQATLRSSGMYVILTIQDDARRLAIPDVIDTVGVSIDEVFHKHLNYYSRVFRIDDTSRLLLEQKQADIVENIQSPGLIGMLFRYVASEIPQTEQALQELVRRVGARENSLIRRWFKSLNFNTRLFGMLIALLDDAFNLPKYDAEEMYNGIVQKLRSYAGMDGEDIFIDPRRIGIDDLITQAGLTDNSGRIGFSNTFIKQTILEKEVPSYQNLLWVVADLLAEQIEPTVPVAADTRDRLLTGVRQVGTLTLKAAQSAVSNQLSFGQAASVLAHLVGQIGIYRPEKLKRLLMNLGSHQDYEVAQLTAYTLLPLSQNISHHAFMLSLLESWLPLDDKRIVDNDPNYYRSATMVIAETYTRIYQLAATAELGTGQGQPGATEPLGLAGRSLQRLQAMMKVMGQKVGQYEVVADQFQAQLTRILKDETDKIGQQQKRESVVSDGEQQRANELIRQLTAGLVLALTEQGLVNLLRMLDTIANQHPDDVVKLIETWLDEGLNQSKDDEIAFDDDQIEHLLLVEDAAPQSSTDQSDSRKREQRKRQRTLQNVAWRVGILSAAFLFEQSVNKPPREDNSDKNQDEADTTVADNTDLDPTTANDSSLQTSKTKAKETAVPTGSAPAPAKTADAETDAGIAAMGLVQEPVASIDSADGNPKIDSAEKMGQDEASTAGQPGTAALPIERRHRNQVDVQRRFFPLLRLLPQLLASNAFSLDMESFLGSLTRGPDLIGAYKDSIASFRSPEVQRLLEQNPLDVAFRVIRQWYEIMGPDTATRKLWVAEVYPVLLKLMNSSTHGQRPVLRQVLFNQGWLDSPQADVHLMAHALLARSYVLDGAVMDLPARRYGVVLLDGSWRAWQGREAWRHYYARAFQLLQRLSVFTPIRIYHLGSLRLVKTLGDQTDTPILNLKNLQTARLRNRLIMPFFDPIPGQISGVLDPEQCHFVIALTPVQQLLPDVDLEIDEDIPDLLDLLILPSGGASAESLALLNDPFASDAEKEAARASANQSEWEWKDRLFLIAPDRSQIVNQFARVAQQAAQSGSKPMGNVPVSPFLNVIGLEDVEHEVLSVRDIETIEQFLEQSVGRFLQGLPPSRWQADLQTYSPFTDFRMTDLAAAKMQLDLWIERLDDVEEARHPRDVTLTIMWTLLTIATAKMPAAAGFVYDWLTSQNPRAQSIGIAATKLLYNFADVSADVISNPTRYEPLLTLLEPFIMLDRGDSEFRQILRIIMAWARHSVWAERLLNPPHATKASLLEEEPEARESELLNAVRKLTRKQDVFFLQQLLAVNEILINYTAIYNNSGLRWVEFTAFVNKTWTWYDQRTREQREENRAVFTRAISLPDNPIKTALVTRTEAVFDLINSSVGTQAAVGTASGPYLLLLLERVVQSLAQSDASWLETAAGNIKQVADRIRLQVYNRVAQPMPKLTDGKLYGIVLLTVSPASDQMISTVIGFIKYFKRRAKERGIDHIILNIHRVGRAELVFAARNGVPTRNELRPPGLPHFAPLIGPALDRYTPSDVAFVLVATTDRLIDALDYAEETNWVDRIWLHTRRRTLWIEQFLGTEMANRRVKDDIIQLTDDILRHIKPED